MLKHISSTSNPEIRHLILLSQKARERKKTGLFVLEGLREFQLALRGGYQIESLYYCPEIISEEALRNVVAASDIRMVGLSPEVYRNLAYRENTEGVIALMKAKQHQLADFQISNPKPLILVAESPEKPGNIGALLRTADAAGLDGVIIADAPGDLYNPNVIRSSVGCVFTIPVALASSKEAISWLQERGVQILAASLEGAVQYDSVDYTRPTAIAVGTEATGLTSQWTSSATAAIKIPMRGVIDSMNVSVAAAILIFEGCRQRGFSSKI
jgi:TrmH family RNA methyltransferase